MSYNWLIAFIGKLTGAANNDAGLFLEFLNFILIILSFVLLLFVCYLLFLVLGGLITAPFNEKISLKVEELVTNSTIISNVSFWKDAYISIKAEMQKLIFYFAVLFFLFILNLIPAVGTVVSSAFGIIFSFFYNALDFLDYPLTRKYIPFWKKVKVTRKGGLVTYGFGAMAFLLMFLPVINVFLKPVLVVSGTALYFEKDYLKFITL